MAGGWSDLSRGSDRWELKLRVSNEGDEVFDLSLEDHDLDARFSEPIFCDAQSGSSNDIAVNDSLERLLGDELSIEYSKL